MIRHLVLWKLKDTPDADEHAEEIRRGLEGLVGQIDGLIAAQVCRGTGSDGSGLLLDSLVRDEAALAYYQEHPLHVAQKEIIARYTAGRVAFDCTVEG